MAPNSNAVSKRHRPRDKFDKKRDMKKCKRIEKAVVSEPPTEDLGEIALVCFCKCFHIVCTQLN